jgi:CheY-like chemotaxis protein
MRSRRILLVEDHPDTADVMALLLRQLGHQVQTADTVARATSLLREGEFDLLLSDIGLPDGTGIDLIREVHRLRPIPAIALTGFGMEEDVARCRDAGFVAHLTKPVGLQDLQAALSQATRVPLDP